MVREILSRLKPVLISLPLVLLAGTLGYYFIEDAYTLFDALYMTVITLATIGYTEIHPLSTAGRAFTIVLSISGLGVAAYAFSTLTAFIVGGELRDVLRRKKMRTRIEELEDHYIVCGGGFTGTAVIEELDKTKRRYVIVEKDPGKSEGWRQDDKLVLEGDALHDETLESAGIRKARGIFCAVDNDRDNVFITLTARGLNNRLRIISEVHDDRVRGKLLRSGADAVVNSERIGGLRLASEMLRPATVGFLDSMIRDRKSTYRFEEVRVPDGSPLIDKPLDAIEVSGGRKPVVVAVKEPQTGRYTVNPSPDMRVGAGDFLVVIGSLEEIGRLEESVKA